MKKILDSIFNSVKVKKLLFFLQLKKKNYFRLKENNWLHGKKTMIKKKDFSSNLDEFIKNQEEYALYFLKLILNNPRRQGGKIMISYYENIEGDGPETILYLNNTMHSNFEVALKFENIFFIEVWDEECFIDFSFCFNKEEHLKLIPLKIRNAMKNLYKKHNREIKRYVLV